MPSGLPRWPGGKEPTCQCRRWQETRVQSLGWEDPLEEEEMGTRYSILAWRIPGTEEPGGLQLHAVLRSQTQRMSMRG